MDLSREEAWGTAGDSSFQDTSEDGAEGWVAGQGAEVSDGVGSQGLPGGSVGAAGNESLKQNRGGLTCQEETEAVLSVRDP